MSYNAGYKLHGGLANRPRKAQSFSMISACFAYKVVFLTLLLFSFFPSCTFGTKHDSVMPCEEIEEAWEKRRYLLPRERNEYCFNGCTFLNVDCHQHTGSAFELPDFSIVTGYLERMANGTYDGWLDSEDVGGFDEDTVNMWMLMFRRTWPLLTSFIPILMNQWKYTSFWGSVAVCLIYIVWNLFGGISVMITLHNCVISLLSLMNSSNSGSMLQSIWTCLIMYVLFGCMFIVGAKGQVLVLIFSILGFFAYLYQVFFVQRKGANAGIFVLLCQLLVLMEQIQYVRHDLMLRSFSGAVVEMLLNAVFPCGKKRLLFGNIAAIARTIQREAVFDAHPLIVIGGAMLLQMFMFLAFRAALGTFYLYVLRYRHSPSNLLWGLFVYTVDTFGGVQYLWRFCTNQERKNGRRIMYCCVNIALNSFEFFWASEIFWFRFWMSIIDKVFLQTHYGKLTHYLEFNVNMSQVAFPQAGSFSWTSLRDVWDVAQGVGSILVEKGGRTYKGIGILVGDVKLSRIYTVKHVVDGCAMMRFKGKTYCNPEWDALGSGDSVVACAVETECEKHLSLIAPDELYEVSHLIYILVDDEGEPMMNVVVNHRIVSNKLVAAVDLKKGDSGGPVIAVLNDGQLRYCGAVSKGSSNQGNGNIMSIVVCNENVEASSDENSLGDVAEFGRARRVRFAGHSGDLGEARKCVNNFIVAHHGILSVFQDDHLTLSMDDFENSNLDEYFIQEVLEDKKPQSSDDEKEDGVGPPDDRGKKGQRKDRKRRQKDKAARKRGGLALQALVAKLRCAYHPDDVRLIYKQLCKGNVPHIRDPLRSYQVNGDSWSSYGPVSQADADWSPECS